ncbi:MAG: uroporphyrinogen-III synthase [bacterium]
MIVPSDARELGERLRGRRVLVTRPEDDAAAWAEGLASFGAVPVLRPSLSCETLRDTETGLRLRTALAACDRLVLTSARAVDALEEILGRPLSIEAPVAAVGARTAERARAAGLHVLLEADGGSVKDIASSLEQDLAAFAPRTPFVLQAGAEETRPGLERLARSGAVRFERIPVYRTRPCPAVPEGEREDVDVDVVLLASPSAVRGLVGRVRLPRGAHVVTLGPSTTAAAREAGLPVAGEAATRDLLGLLRAIPKERSR